MLMVSHKPGLVLRCGEGELMLSFSNLQAGDLPLLKSSGVWRASSILFQYSSEQNFARRDHSTLNYVQELWFRMNLKFEIDSVYFLLNAFIFFHCSLNFGLTTFVALLTGVSVYHYNTFNQQCLSSKNQLYKRPISYMCLEIQQPGKKKLSFHCWKAIRSWSLKTKHF